ncbi:MAG TPA: hypothetical protein PK919_10675 [Candidatus Aminicenantes bacterium]|nr:hypothetical protein [Candidatus Aminicenantes bacterium]
MAILLGCFQKNYTIAVKAGRDAEFAKKPRVGYNEPSQKIGWRDNKEDEWQSS